MKTVTKYRNQKILVLGLARSGISAAQLLHQLGALVTVNDSKELSENPAAQDLLSAGIRVVTGSHPVELLDEDFILVVKNPGIPYTNPILKRAIEKKLPIITEVELAYEIATAKIIGITGTNGKTTTTTMIGQILNNGLSSGKALLAGNIGAPVSTEAQHAGESDYLVTELSSFQLMGTMEFKPEIAVITNLYEAHLDYHGTREEYVAAKWRLQANMVADDYLVLNGNQQELRELAETTQAAVIFFSTTAVLEEGAYVAKGTIYYNGEAVMPTSDLGVPGGHNLENALAAVIVAKLCGVASEVIASSLKQFTGVEHRTEFVAKINGCNYYNDSKATNILATEKALSGFDTSKVVLLAGGLDRGNDFEELEPSLVGLKAVILFGESREKLKIAAINAGVGNILLVETVTEAVAGSLTYSREGDSVLLSPACASWDQFKNFEVRGQTFKEAVKNIKDSK